MLLTRMQPRMHIDTEGERGKRTVTTARFTSPLSARKACAMSRIFVSTMDDTSSGAKDFVSPLNCTCSIGLSPAAFRTLKGQCFMSSWTLGSWNLRPMRRFASKTLRGTG
jgi:hypothetical protein